MYKNLHTTQASSSKNTYAGLEEQEEFPNYSDLYIDTVENEIFQSLQTALYFYAPCLTGVSIIERKRQEVAGFLETNSVFGDEEKKSLVKFATDNGFEFSVLLFIAEIATSIAHSAVANITMDARDDVSSTDMDIQSPSPASIAPKP